MFGREFKAAEHRRHIPPTQRVGYGIEPVGSRTADRWVLDDLAEMAGMSTRLSNGWEVLQTNGGGPVLFREFNDYDSGKVSPPDSPGGPWNWSVHARLYQVNVGSGAANSADEAMSMVEQTYAEYKRTAARKTASWDQEYDGTWFGSFPNDVLGWLIPSRDSEFPDTYTVSAEIDRPGDSRVLFTEFNVSLEEGKRMVEEAAAQVTSSRTTAGECPKCDGMGRETYETDTGSLSTQTCTACGGAGQAKEAARKTAFLDTVEFTEPRHRVAGWDWDDHLNGFIAAEAAREFTCSCGSNIPAPGYTDCRCGKRWNAYSVLANGERKLIAREVPVRDGVVMASRTASRKQAADYSNYSYDQLVDERDTLRQQYADWEIDQSEYRDTLAEIEAEAESRGLSLASRKGRVMARHATRKQAVGWSKGTHPDISGLSDEQLQDFIDNVQESIDAGANVGEVMKNKRDRFEEELRSRGRTASHRTANRKSALKYEWTEPSTGPYDEGHSYLISPDESVGASVYPYQGGYSYSVWDDESSFSGEQFFNTLEEAKEGTELVMQQSGRLASRKLANDYQFDGGWSARVVYDNDDEGEYAEAILTGPGGVKETIYPWNGRTFERAEIEEQAWEIITDYGDSVYRDTYQYNSYREAASHNLSDVQYDPSVLNEGDFVFTSSGRHLIDKIEQPDAQGIMRLHTSAGSVLTVRSRTASHRTAETVNSENLQVGDVVKYGDETITIIGEQEYWQDPFGRDMMKYMARSSDGREGYVMFGYGASLPKLASTRTASRKQAAPNPSTVILEHFHGWKVDDDDGNFWEIQSPGGEHALVHEGNGVYTILMNDNTPDEFWGTGLSFEDALAEMRAEGII